MPLWLAEQAVGVLVPDDGFVRRVPLKFAAEHVGEVGQITQRRGAVSDLDVDRGPIVRFSDRFEPIRHVIHVEVIGILVGTVRIRQGAP
jgi:hypothetical protein